MNMNKGNHFPHNKKQQKHPSQGGKPQWPGHQQDKNPKHNPGHQQDKPQWPGQKDKC